MVIKSISFDTSGEVGLIPTDDNKLGVSIPPVYLEIDGVAYKDGKIGGIKDTPFTFNIGPVNLSFDVDTSLGIEDPTNPPEQFFLDFENPEFDISLKIKFSSKNIVLTTLAATINSDATSKKIEGMVVDELTKVFEKLNLVDMKKGFCYTNLQEILADFKKPINLPDLPFSNCLALPTSINFPIIQESSS